MVHPFLIPFLAIGLAELGDKTQLAIVSLSSNTTSKWRLLLGVMLAFLITDGLAVLLGATIPLVIPINIVKIAAGCIFILFGILMLVNNKDKKEKHEIKSPFLTSFILIMTSEMGDKSQIATGLFATQYNPWMVLGSVLTALLILSMIAIFIGKFIRDKVNYKLIHTIAGILFIIIGAVTLI